MHKNAIMFETFCWRMKNIYRLLWNMKLSTSATCGALSSSSSKWAGVGGNDSSYPAVISNSKYPKAKTSGAYGCFGDKPNREFSRPANRAAPFWIITLPLCKWWKGGKCLVFRKSRASRICLPKHWTCQKINKVKLLWGEAVEKR